MCLQIVSSQKWRAFSKDHTVTAPITSNRPTTTRLHHYAGRHSHGSGIPVETFFAPAWGASTPVEIFFAHAHPKWLIFDHFHLAGAIFLSQRHPKLPPGATQGRSFFHTAPRDDTESPPVWRAPRGMGPGRGAGGRWRGLAGLRGDAPSHTSATKRHWCGGRRRARRDWLRCPWAVAGPGRGAGGWRQGQGGPRDRPLRAQLACGDLAGGPPPTGTLSGQAHRTGSTAGGPPPTGTPSSPAQQAAGYAKGAGTEVPAPCRLTQPLPRRGSGRMILSPGDGDASTGTCRPRRPLPGPLRRSGRRSRCGRGPSSAWWPGRRARRNRSSRR